MNKKYIKNIRLKIIIAFFIIFQINFCYKVFAKYNYKFALNVGNITTAILKDGKKEEINKEKSKIENIEGKSFYIIEKKVKKTKDDLVNVEYK